MLLSQEDLTKQDLVLTVINHGGSHWTLLVCTTSKIMYNDNSAHGCDSLAVLYKNTYTQILVLTVFHFPKSDGHENQNR